jgi:hypothetical protein
LSPFATKVSLSPFSFDIFDFGAMFVVDASIVSRL